MVPESKQRVLGSNPSGNVFHYYIPKSSHVINNVLLQSEVDQFNDN